jgi:hypothetical protein
MYEFKCEDGEVVELFLSFAEHDRRVKNDTIKLDDGRMARTFWNSKSGISTVPANYPMVSTAAGVHPADVKKHMEYLASKGCGQINHTKDGDVIFESKGQRKRVLECLGLFDRNGGFSDPQPKHRTANVRKYR